LARSPLEIGAATSTPIAGSSEADGRDRNRQAAAIRE